MLSRIILNFFISPLYVNNHMALPPTTLKLLARTIATGRIIYVLSLDSVNVYIEIDASYWTNIFFSSSPIVFVFLKQGRPLVVANTMRVSSLIIFAYMKQGYMFNSMSNTHQILELDFNFLDELL